MKLNTTGADNIALAAALTDNTIGNFNTAVGWAMFENVFEVAISVWGFLYCPTIQRRSKYISL